MAGETHTTDAILERLVAFDTTSRLSNLELISYIQSYLQDFEIESEIQLNEEGSKANIIATIGPNVPGGVVLSGHTDVVPVDGQDWTTEPFKLTEKDGKLHARGSADMKGFIASALAAVPAFKAAELKRPIHFAFTYDEEVGCLGIQSLLPLMKDHIAAPRLVVVGEPTSMQVANAHKGQYVSKTRIWGREAHSSRPEDGINAVAVAAELITFIGSLGAKARIHGPHDESFDPTYTSFNVGPISGGSAFNIIPNYCEFDWEFRAVPTADPAAILKEYTDFLDNVINPHLQASFPECRAENTVWAYLPPLKAEPGSDAETLALALAGRNDTTVVAFGTEAGHIQSIDFPAVVCGPGDIAQAHKPDEFIDKSQLDACDAFMKRLAEVMGS
ncbi:acetylornithine deacetylase [Kordiimonas lipolytica]|uniref:Acetylornithine deacetylase n=1 Tax=Kordiimonas lipolytica TaxID=1662421 RepID=A0ABV8UFT6_9PROT|nr:acetylornithine deacetylase [Kordiimonas lipolytica]